MDPISAAEQGLRALDADAIDCIMSERETERRYDRFLRSLDGKTELNRHDYRKFAYYLFGAKFRRELRTALLSGQILMGDGRVIRRANHVDMTKDAA